MCVCVFVCVCVRWSPLVGMLCNVRRVGSSYQLTCGQTEKVYLPVHVCACTRAYCQLCVFTHARARVRYRRVCIDGCLCARVCLCTGNGICNYVIVGVRTCVCAHECVLCVLACAFLYEFNLKACAFSLARANFMRF